MGRYAKTEEQAKLAKDEAEALLSCLNDSTARDGDPIDSLATARKHLENITRFVEAAELAMPPSAAEASDRNMREAGFQAAPGSKVNVVTGKGGVKHVEFEKPEKPPPSRGAGGRY